MKKQINKLKLSISTIQVLANLELVRGGEIVDSQGCATVCMTYCRVLGCKPSPYSRAGDYCV